MVIIASQERWCDGRETDDLRIREKWKSSLADIGVISIGLINRGGGTWG